MPAEQPDYDFLDELLTRHAQIRDALVKRLDAGELDKELRSEALIAQREMLLTEKRLTSMARAARRMLHIRLSGGSGA